MFDNYRINDHFDQGHLPTECSEGIDKAFSFDYEPHDEIAGHIVHKLSAEQATRLVDHEAATIFSIKAADVERLKSSIDQFGQQIPVVLYEDKVLDGRCRIKACAELGIPVLAIRFDATDLDGHSPKQWVLHRNRSTTDGRRITDAEYALIVAAVYGPEASEQALQRKRSGVAVDGALRGETSAMLGATFNLPPSLMKQALKLFNSGDADLLQLVKDKKLSLSKAAEILKLSTAKRKAVMSDPKAPLPITSPNKALAKYKSAVKSLKKFYMQVNDISGSRHFSRETRRSIEPTLLQMRDAVAALEKVKSLPEQSDAQT